MVIMQLISSFVYATYIVQCLYFKKTKFPASSHLENQSLNTRGGGGGSKLAFDIINEHLYTPCMLRLFQTVKSLNILNLTAILDSMHITPTNNCRLYLNLHKFIIKVYY